MISIIRAVGNWAVSLMQLLALLLTALLVGWWWGEPLEWDILYGGMISVVNLRWLQWRLRRSEKRQTIERIEQASEESARKIAADLYMTAMERFLIVTTLFVLGMVELQLNPMALIAGFVVGQLAMLAGSQRLGNPHPA